LLNSVQKNSTINLSCRLDKKVYEILVQEAEKKGISINSLVNSIAKKYIAWEKNADEIGFVPLTKRAVRQIFTEVEKNKLLEIADGVGRTVPRDLMMLNFNHIDLDNVISTIDIWGSRFGTVKHDVVDSKHTFTIYHKINQNFSDYVIALHAAMADDLGFKMTKKDANSTLAAFTIEPVK
jgi:hypothetical protein